MKSYSLSKKEIKLYLTEIHDNALMNLLPQVSPKDLNEGDLQCGDLAVHKDSRQVELYLETHVHLKTENVGQDRHLDSSLYGTFFFFYRNIKIHLQMLVVLTLALLMVGDHQSVKRRLGIWFRPDLWALVSFFHFMDSSKPLAFSLKSKKHFQVS